MLKERLEIILVTYNRKIFLKKTLEKLFSESSPVKNLSITVLDNASDDGTGELIDEYCLKYPNITHIIHNHNIGGNANIARAFEIAKKEYVWVLCDDDIYDWSNFREVEKAIEDSHDVIVTALHNIRNPQNMSDIIFQLTFLPAGIYKTALINVDVMRNVYDNICNFMPHLPVAIYAANNAKDFYILSKPIVKNGYEEALKNGEETADISSVRGNNKSELYPVIRNSCWYICYIKSLALLKDKNAIKNGIKSALSYPILGKNIFDVIRQIVYMSLRDKKSSYLFYDIYFQVDFKLKCLMLYYRYFPCVYTSDKGVYLQLFNKLKIKLIPLKKGKNK